MAAEDDWQNQLDELVALQAILGSDAVTLEGSSSSSCAEGEALTEEAVEALRAAPAPPGGLRLAVACRVELPEEGLLLTETSRAGETEAFGRVHHLPPLLLRLTLPRDYPSASPPGVALAAAWLAAPQGATLRGALLQQWREEGPGQPICFSWADWLQREALAALGCSAALDFREGAGPPSSQDEEEAAPPGGSSGAGEAGQRSSSAGQGVSEEEAQVAGHSISSSRGRSGDGGGSGGTEAPGGSREGTLANGQGPQPPALPLPLQLLQYDAGRKRQAFLQGTWECGVCFEEVPGRDCVHPAACRHFYCGACVQGVCRAALSEAAVDRLRCPDPECRSPFARERVAALLTPQESERWEAVELERALARMADAAVCPRCSTVCLGESACAQCPRCLFAFCPKCRAAWHPGEPCSSASVELARLQQQLAGSASASQREELRRRKLELQSLYTIEKISKACPTCGTAIQKSEGCNKMRCSGCDTNFCWECGQAVRGYGHFGEGSCALFDAAALEAWEAYVGGRPDLAAQRQAQRQHEMAERVRKEGGLPCPQVLPLIGAGSGAKCKAANVRQERNNHGRCWNCGGSFCFLCRTPLRGTKGHFTRAHPQHS